MAIGFFSVAVMWIDSRSGLMNGASVAAVEIVLSFNPLLKVTYPLA